MPDVVNDALSLAQFITNGRSEEQAIAYLQAIEGITIDDWKSAKQDLPTADKTNRQTKEGHIKDIVSVFKNEDIGTTFCMRNLSFCPGFSREAIELVFYSSATVHCIKKISSNIIERERIEKNPSRSTSHPTAIQLQQSTLHAPVQQSLSETEYPTLGSKENANNALNTAISNSGGSTTPPSGWNTSRSLPYQKAGNPNVEKIRQRSKERFTVHGTSPSSNSTIGHQLRFLCLGVRSGAEETVESLTEVLNKWNYLRQLKVEAVRKSDYSTTFRVQFILPTSLYTKWKDPTVWPARMSASEWRGNPKAILKPLAEREYKMRIYIGNLSETTTPQKITENMKTVYNKEIENGTIKSVETFINQAGLERAQKKHSQDPSQMITKSACVVLTLHQGKSPTDVGLNLNRYSHEIRKTVRKWNGPTPQPREQPPIHLDW